MYIRVFDIGTQPLDALFFLSNFFPTFFSLHFNLYNFYYSIFKYFDSSLCLSLLMISHKAFFIFDHVFFSSNISISLFLTVPNFYTAITLLICMLPSISIRAL